MMQEMRKMRRELDEMRKRQSEQMIRDGVGDGKFDTALQDTRGDGKDDTLKKDTTGDGKLDSIAAARVVNDSQTAAAALEFAIQRERGRGEHSNASGIVAMYEPRFRLTLS